MDDQQPYCPTEVPSATPAQSRPGTSCADCVLCARPTEYALDTPGVVLCPVCEWQEAQRGACSG
ncbi:hypothetical protein [Streptomyces sp. NPDC006879]|uniref:hypothetical protein n=1 Tax=Streptomyces sp. NPDC006879 TaxID=3364767 RepID=UPI0036CF0AB0